MKMYVAGEWVDSPETTAVVSPYTGEVIDRVPSATPEQVERTLQAAERAAVVMARLSGHERSRILHRAAELVDANLDDLSRTITLELGKPISESRVEVARMPDLLRLSAFEGSQIRGETLPLDAQAGAT